MSSQEEIRKSWEDYPTREQDRRDTLEALFAHVLEGKDLGGRTRAELLTALREEDEEATRRHLCKVVEILEACERKMRCIEKGYDAQDPLGLYQAVAGLEKSDIKHVLLAVYVVQAHLQKIVTVLDPASEIRKEIQIQ